MQVYLLVYSISYKCLPMQIDFAIIIFKQIWVFFTDKTTFLQINHNVGCLPVHASRTSTIVSTGKRRMGKRIFNHNIFKYTQKVNGIFSNWISCHRKHQYWSYGDIGFGCNINNKKTKIARLKKKN